MADRGRIVRVRKGDLIIQEGMRDMRAYQIIAGRVKVYTTHKGRRYALGRLGVGEAFGEIALVSNAPRIASVVAEEDCTLRAITRPVFNRLLRRNPRAVVPLLTALVERLREMNRKYLTALEARGVPKPSAYFDAEANTPSQSAGGGLV
ncbi:MAG: cyclic nucleotide-binding domain-containing protein [Candidatus Omnitrophica bacterium]|nr:cyclic nucleotide-binding domain-containing protein [Candidatus Omnitrophota bacterium]